MTPEWSVLLPDEFNRRIEEGSLVLWRPTLTFWIAAWGDERGLSKEERMNSTLRSASAYRQHEQVERTSKLIRLTYELPEEDPERPKPVYTSISGYVFAAAGHLQISAYFDTPVARTLGYQVIHSVQNVA